MSIDRTLLFGVLAFQNGLIDRDTLISALQVWLEGKSKPLSEILVQLKSGSHEEFELLNRLVDLHHYKHGLDPQKSLASLSSLDSILNDLLQLGDAEINAALTLSLNSPVTRPWQKDPLDTEQTQIFDGGKGQSNAKVTSYGKSRFRILRSHARGGLGEVFVAQDEELHRDVALKQIQPQFANHPDSRNRFMLEAEVTGGLEHPGIVPVYGLGQYEDGRPYYAMRFIKGDSLKEAIDQFHGKTKKSELPDATEAIPQKLDTSGADYQGLGFRQLLGRFVDVCQAVSYAHSRGVLHRDLKPGNIMLGKYGETLVVDWGLAKVQGFEAATETLIETTLTPTSGSGVTPTVMGSAIGTPAYMPPEQAAGKLDELGPASDVYSLGATLYHLLTGRAAFGGKNIVDLLKAVQSGNFPSPRTLSPRIPKGLEAVCLKAMSLSPGDRYRSPQNLADEIEKFLADEPVSAFVEPFSVRSRRWVKRNQTLVVSAAAGVLVASVSLLLLLVVVARKNNELEQANQREQAAKIQAVGNATRAEANASVAREQTQLALESLGFVIFDIQRGLRNVPGSGSVQRKLIQDSLERLEKVSDQFASQSTIDRNTKVALDRLGDLLLRIGSDGNSRDPQGPLAAARRVFERLLEVSKNSAERNPEDESAQRDLAMALDKLGDVQLRSSQVDEALVSYKTSFETRQKLYSRNPEDTLAQRELSLSFELLGGVYLNLGKNTDALQVFEKCLEIRQKIATKVPNDSEAQRDLSTSLINVGEMQLRGGHVAEALQTYKKSLQISEDLVTESPQNSKAQRDQSIALEKIGNALLRNGQVTEALHSFEESMAIRQSLWEAETNDAQAERELLVSLDRIGNLKLRSGLISEALRTFENCLERRGRLAAADPTDAQAQQDLSISYEQVGNVKLQSGLVNEAIESYQKSLDILERLAATDPSDSEAQRHLSIALNNIGRAQLQSGLVTQALQSQTRSVEIFQRLAVVDTSDLQARVESSVALGDLGNAQLQSGQAKEALQSFEKSLEISQALASESPNDARAQHTLSSSLDKVGDLHLQNGQLTEALRVYERMLEISQRMTVADPSDIQAQRDLSISFAKLGSASLQSGRVNQALELYEKGLAITQKLVATDPMDARAQREMSISLESLGQVQLQNGKSNEAIETYEECLKIRQKLALAAPDDAQAQRDLSIALISIGDARLQSDQVKEALESYLKSMEIRQRMAAKDPNDARAQRNLFITFQKIGDLYLHTGQATEALESFEKSLEISQKLAAKDPNGVRTQRDLWYTFYMLGEIELATNRFDRALVHFDKALQRVKDLKDRAMLMPSDQETPSTLEELIQKCRFNATALGDWKALLEQPKELLPSLLEMRGIEMTTSGRIDEAIQAADKLRELGTVTGDQLYNCACIYSVSAAAIKPADDRVLTAEETRKRQQYLERAIGSLRDAIAAGYENFAHMGSDKDLTPLHELPEFQKLLSTQKN